jgi:hypothetical protein
MLDVMLYLLCNLSKRSPDNQRKSNLPMDFFGFHQANNITLQFAAWRGLYCATPWTIFPSTFRDTQGKLFMHTPATELFIISFQPFF